MSESPAPSVYDRVSGSFSARLVRRAPVAHATLDVTFDLEAPGRLDFQPGQFLTMILAGASAEAGGLKRSYSLASSSSPADVLRFIVRLVPDGAASQALLALPLGAMVSFTGPHGFFTLEPAHVGDVVFVATGTGMAALLPMLARLATQPPTGRRLLVWGLRREEDIFALDEVKDLCERATTTLRIFLSAPGATWSEGRGRVIAPVLDELPTLREPMFYLVGNGGMIAALKGELVARGVNRKKQIRTEAFFD